MMIIVEVMMMMMVTSTALLLLLLTLMMIITLLMLLVEGAISLRIFSSPFHLLITRFFGVGSSDIERLFSRQSIISHPHRGIALRGQPPISSHPLIRQEQHQCQAKVSSAAAVIGRLHDTRWCLRLLRRRRHSLWCERTTAEEEARKTSEENAQFLVLLKFLFVLRRVLQSIAAKEDQ